MVKKFANFLFLFFICFIGIQSVKAEKFNIHFRCNSNQSDGLCNFSIVDGELLNGSAGCKILTGASTSVNLEINRSKVDIKGASNCYKVDYTCESVFEDKKKTKFHYEITKMTFTPTSETKTDVSKGILCPSKPLIDMCADYNESNFSSKCKNKDADYKTFRGKCDLAYQDAMDYCEGKGNYIDAQSSGGASIDEIRDKAGRIVDDTDGSREIKSSEGQTCTSLINDDIASILKGIFLVISVAGVIILVVTMVSDFIKAIASSDNDAMAKAFNSAKTRIIATIILLILPALVSFIINLINNNTIVVTDSANNKIEVKIGDPLDCKVVD